MNSQHPHHQALDADELELARVVRALPGGGPPPALDARILKAAQDAVAAAPSRRRRPWLALGSVWGASSAAAAVLALGVGWQLLNAPRSTMPASDSAPAPVAVVAEKQHRTEVDFIRREPPPLTTPPPAESVASAVLPAPRQAPQPQRERVEPQQTDPEPFIDEHVTAVASARMADAAAASDTASASEDDRRDQSMRRESSSVAMEMAKANAPAAPPPAAAAYGYSGTSQGRNNAGTLDHLGASASTSAAPVHEQRSTLFEGNPALRARVASDATLSREAWLSRIRQRMHDKDMAGARASLALYLEKYPDGAGTLPGDLRRLLKK